MPKLFQSLVYLQIRRSWLSVRVITWSGGDFRWEGSTEAFIGFDRKGRAQIVGAEDARQTPGLVGTYFRAFAHPRLIIDNGDEAQAFVNYAIRESGYKRKSNNLLFLVHVRDTWEGGISQIEQKALTEMSRKCGASQVRLLDQPFELAPPQLLEIARSKAIRDS